MSTKGQPIAWVTALSAPAIALLSMVNSAQGGCPYTCPVSPCYDVIVGDVVTIESVTPTATCRLTEDQNPPGVVDAEDWAVYLGLEVSPGDRDEKVSYSYVQHPITCVCLLEQQVTDLWDEAAGLSVDWDFVGSAVDLTVPGTYVLSATACNITPDQVSCSGDPGYTYPWYEDECAEPLFFTITVTSHDGCCYDPGQGMTDCNNNSISDECDVTLGEDPDCNENGVPDSCDIASGTSTDANSDDVPDECEQWRVDVDVDSDNDNGTRYPDRSTTEEALEEDTETPGKVVFINDDDDDADGFLDYSYLDGETPGENDLAPVIVSILPPEGTAPGTTVSYQVVVDTLEGGWHFPTYGRLWRRSTRGSEDYSNMVQLGVSHLLTLQLLGDADGDNGSILDQADLDAFDLFLSDPAQYAIDHAVVDIARLGDMNQDGWVTHADRPFLVAAIENGRRRFVPLVVWLEAKATCPVAFRVHAKVDANANGIFDASDPEDVVRIRTWGASGCSGGYDYGVPDGMDGSQSIPLPADTTLQPPFDSRCWGYITSQVTTPNREGFHPNLDVAQPFGPGDFPPISLDSRASTSPLVSKASRHFGTSMQLAERVTHGGVADFATGSPLLREVDFELPFGGAVFRHVRTYSENFHEPALAIQGCPDGWGAGGGEGGTCVHWTSTVGGTYYDWNGMNWMMGEAPVLLIDAQYNGIVTPGLKRCYLIPDAHSAIPFEWVEGVEQYVAPPWFDAAMRYEDADSDGRPETYYVWLHRRTVKYTFKPLHEDMPLMRADDGSYVSAHAPKSEGGEGLPYRALLTRIEDQYGNAVELSYCDFTQGHRDDDPDPSGCKPLCQGCARKGMLRSARLRTSDGAVSWTLLYTFRDFVPGESTFAAWDAPSLVRPVMLHSVHAYDGDVDVGAYACAVITAETFINHASFDDYDNVDAEALGLVPAGWKIRSSYVYEEGIECAYMVDGCGSGLSDYVHSYALNGGGIKNMFGGMLLLKATTVRRTDETADPAPQHFMYSYESADLDNGRQTASQKFHLSRIYDPARVAEALKDKQATDPEASVNFILETSENVEPSVGLTYDHWSVPQSAVHELANAIGLPIRQSVHRDDGVYRFLDNRPTAPTGAEVAIHLFVQFPDEFVYDPWYSDTDLPDLYPTSTGSPTVFHYPYRICAGERNSPVCTGPQPGDLKNPDFKDPRFVAVVDEIADPLSYDPGTGRGVRLRRVVELNPAGMLLRERQYSFEEDPEGQLVSQEGFAESYKCDCKGRILEARSAGWSVAEGEGNGENEGLIYVFEYAGAACSTNSFRILPQDAEIPDEPVAVGVKRGENNTVYYISKIERHSHRPEIPTSETRFPTPVTDPESAAGLTTVWDYRFEDGFLYVDPLTQEVRVNWDAGIKEKWVYYPEVATENDGTQRGTERYLYDDNGNLIWQGRGRIDVLTGANIEFYTSYTGYNDQGQNDITVVDVDASNLPGGATYPEGTEWLRAGETDPLHLVTTMEYDDVWGLRKVVFPNLRESHIVYKQEGAADLDVWTYPMVDPGTHRASVPIEITSIRGGRPLSKVTVDIPFVHDPPDGKEDYTPEQIISSISLEYNEQGRVEQVQQAEGDGQPGDGQSVVTRSIQYFPNGTPQRVEGPEGTIQRFTFNERGQVRGVYQGSNDIHDFWGTAIACDCVNHPECENPEAGYYCSGDFPDNMVLIEKRYYGDGVNDAGKLVSIRGYRQKPDNQYYMYDENGCAPGETPGNCTGWWIGDDWDEQACAPGQTPPCSGWWIGDVPNEDAIGVSTLSLYDWRMREAWVKRYDEDHGSGSSLRRQTLTWYDNLDRPILVAEYGGSVPTSVEAVAATALDPAESSLAYVQSTVIPAILAVQASEEPLSLTLTIYNNRGQVEESRNYLVGDAGTTCTEPAGCYTATKTYYDHADRPVEVHAPNSPIQRYVYNAKGQQVLSKTMAGSTEVSVTETFYDNNDRAIITKRYERAPNASGDEITGAASSNAVISWAYTWYDKAGRVIASADFGTNNSTFSTGTEPPVHEGLVMAGQTGMGPPVTYDANGEITACGCSTNCEYARVTCYGYDEAGRQNMVVEPGGIATRTEYDGLGRVVMTTENAAWGTHTPTADQQRRTAYQYDSTTGQLLKVAAVLPEHKSGAGGVTCFTDVDWEAADGTLQVTEYVYDAVVMDDNGSGSYSAVSASKTWVSGVKYPDPETGQPELDPSIAFSYRLDGQVAQRTDGRGVMLAYDYDDEDRLGAITSVVPEGLGDGSLGDVDVTATGMQYSYHPDGQLWHATTLAGVGGTLNDSVFTYGPFGLTATAEQNFNAVTRNVGYQWNLDLYSATNTQSANRWRLIGMTYPDGLNANLTFGYGSANSLDDLLNRVAAITRGGQTLATWQYMGLSRELSEAFGSGASEVTRTYVSGGAVTGLDGQGRVTDIPWTDSSANNLLRYQYGYDVRGNRSFARITIPGLASQYRSWLYRYDDLNRLVRASQGVLNPAGDGFEPTSSAQSHTWALDNLGNWSAGTSDDSFRLFTEPAGAVDGIFNAGDTPLFRHHHAVTQQNEITTRWVGESGGDPVPENFAYDTTGNLILDDDYYYVYDSFNRVAAIYERGTVTSEAGVLTGDTEDLGPCLARYTYDALGRRVKTHSNPGQPGQTITRHVYGTGAAVLAEYDVNPSTNEETALRWFVHGEGFPEPLAMVDRSAAGDNSTPGVEEFLYYLTDVQGSVGALTNAIGQVVERYFYTPYGQTAITAADGTTPRTESLYGNPFAYTGQRYEPQTGLYHFWARVYSPTLGRFLQEDPLGVFSMLGPRLAFRGSPTAPRTKSLALSVRIRRADDHNLFVYALCNPAMLTDPTGLTALGLSMAESGASGASMWTTAATAAGGVFEYAQSVAIAAAMYSYEASMVSLLVFGVQESGVDFTGDWERFREWMANNTSVKMSSKTADAVEKCKQLKDTLYWHTDAVSTGGPGDQGVNHHIREIKGYLEKLRSHIRRMKDGSRTKEAWENFADDLENWLNDPWGGGPPLMPG